MRRTWEVAGRPEELGIPSRAVLDLLARLDRRGLNSHSLLVARHGRLAFEGYWAPFAADVPHRLYSASKSYVSLAIGALADDGAIGLTDRLVDHFPDKVPAQVHPYVAQMRVVDLLTMRTAHGSTTYKQVEDPDWVATFFTVAPTRMPGTLFSYDTSATVVLAALVERTSGQRLPDYLMDRVLSPIGAEHPVTALVSPTGTTAAERQGRPTARELEDNPRGVAHGGSGLFATPRDFLRFAQLCLQQGRWDGAQVVSAEYLRAATGYQTSTAHVPGWLPDSRCGYGYQFWRNRHGAFSARGMGGQIALCVPEEDLAVVVTGDNQGHLGADQAFFDAVWEVLLPALDAPGPHPAQEAEELAQAAAALALPTVPAARADVTRPFAARWHLEQQEGPFAGMELHTDRRGGALRLTGRDGRVRELPFGTGHLVRHELPGYGYPTLSSGAWLDEQTFRMHSHVLGQYLAQIEITVTLRADAVVVVMAAAAELFAEEFHGTITGRRAD